MNDQPAKVAVVTGAARGIGQATARALSSRGFAVALIDRLAGELEATASLITRAGSTCMPLLGDVADFAGVQQQAHVVLEHWGRVDVLVNNAGIGQPKGILEITEAEWDLTIAVDLKGCFNWCKAIAPVMVRQGSGRIVNISSVSANTGASKHAVSKFAYCAAKAGILGLTRGLAKELAPAVTVNAICPGPIETDLTRAKWASMKEGILQGIPLGRLGTPEDIAEVVVFLATASPMFITGEIIDVDGGAYVN
jgi:3-oxoacyl-[acyl-carrier protein] reductase